MKTPPSPLSSTLSPVPGSSPSPQPSRSALVYEPPRIEDDLPLEVMSLACTGFRPKTTTPLPCRILGS